MSSVRALMPRLIRGPAGSGSPLLRPRSKCKNGDMAEVPIRRIALILAVLFVAGACGLAYTGYHRDIKQARERVATGSQVVQTPCGPIEYAAAGNGKPVLVVRGAGGGFDGTGLCEASGPQRIARDRHVAIRVSAHPAAGRRLGRRAG